MEVLAPLYTTSINLLTQVVGPVTVALMDELKVPVYACLVAHFIFMALRIGGQIGQFSVPQFFWEVIKVNVVTQAALTAGGYQMAIVGTTEQLQAIIAGALTMGSADTSVNVYATLDGIVQQGLDMAMVALKKVITVGWRLDVGFMWGLAALVIFGCSLWVAAVAAFMILGATLLIGMLTAIGPLFLVSLLFPITIRYAMSWINGLVTQVVTITLGIITATIAAGMFGAILTQLGDLGGEVAPLSVGGVTILVAGFMAYVYKKVDNVAANLSGGISTGTMTLNDAIKGPEKMVAPLLNESTRQDLETGHMERAPWIAHAYKGNTRLNGRYNARTASNFGKHYAWRDKGRIADMGKK